MLNHVQNDHNMWSYIYYFMHINDMETCDFSALDMYVNNLVCSTGHLENIFFAVTKDIDASLK